MRSLPHALAQWPAAALKALAYLLSGHCQGDPLAFEPADTRDFERPYEPSEDDWAEYSRWADALAGRRDTPDPHAEPWGDFCPADFGQPCPACDLAAAEAAALRHDADARDDGWYLDLVLRAEGGSNGGDPDWRAW